MNTKKIGLMALFVVLFAGGIMAVNAAFTSSKAEPAKATNTYYYGNKGSGNYVLLQNPVNAGLCDDPDANSCVLMSEELREEGFIWSNKPADATPTSGSTAIYDGN